MLFDRFTINLFLKLVEIYDNCKKEYKGEIHDIVVTIFKLLKLNHKLLLSDVVERNDDTNYI